MEYRFDFEGDSTTEDLYLCFEGLAWQADILLNDRYLGQSSDPFKLWYVKLDREWLKTNGNLLKVSVAPGKHKQWYPRHFVGLHRPAWLLEHKHIKEIERRLHVPTINQPERVMVFAPWYRKSGFVFDRFEACRALLPLVGHKDRAIYFAYPPCRQLVQTCRLLGIRQVRELEPGVKVSWLNTYPYEGTHFKGGGTFWLDEHANRSTHYAGYQYHGQSAARLNAGGWTSLGLMLLLLVPILGLLLIKLLSPGLFYNMGGILTRPQLFLDQFVETSTSNLGMLVILLILKVLLLATSLALFVYYIDMSHQWSWLNVLKDSALLNLLFYNRGGLGQYLLISLVLVSLGYVLRYVLLGMAGSVYRVNGMLPSLMGLETGISFPLLLLLPVMLVLLLLTPGAYQLWVLGIIALLCLFYVARQVFLVHNGIDKLFGFSSGIKILYICTLNFLPLVIWL